MTIKDHHHHHHHQRALLTAPPRQQAEESFPPPLRAVGYQRDRTIIVNPNIISSSITTIIITTITATLAMARRRSLSLLFKRWCTSVTARVGCWGPRPSSNGCGNT
jgi:hypothetical protein